MFSFPGSYHTDFQCDLPIWLLPDIRENSHCSTSSPTFGMSVFLVLSILGISVLICIEEHGLHFLKLGANGSSRYSPIYNNTEDKVWREAPQDLESGQQSGSVPRVYSPGSRRTSGELLGRYKKGQFWDLWGIGRDTQFCIKIRLINDSPLFARHSIKPSLHLHKWKMLEYCLICMWGKWGTERLSYFPKVTQAVIRGDWTQLEPYYS